MKARVIREDVKLLTDRGMKMDLMNKPNQSGNYENKERCNYTALHPHTCS